jgi:pimeloyl-ACP methyl ester carboxylesterase
MAPQLVKKLFLSMVILSASHCGVDALRASYAVFPKAEDNFLEAQFRLLVPNPRQVLAGIIVLLPGTDGDARGWVDDRAWRQCAEDNNLTLIGCYYRGEGLSYDIPDQGSGKALDEALAYFSGTLNQPQFKTLPLLLFGHSQGAQFAYNYVGWQPERVEAFVSVKPGGYTVVPQAASYQVSGVIIAGEHDESQRIKTAVSAILDTKGQGTRWCFLYERNSDHEIGQSAEFARRYFVSVLQADKANQGVWLDPRLGRISKNPDERQIPMGWLPDNKTAQLWQQIHKPAKLQSLLQLPPKPSLSMVRMS